jgi:ketosteroid isomerase-like protein
MSQENVEIVRRYFEAVAQSLETYWVNPRSVTAAMNEAGDLPPEAREVFALMDPEVEWTTVFAGVSFRGHADFARGLDWLLEAAEDFRVTLGEVADLGADQVLAVLDRTFKGKDSEIRITGRLFSLVTLRVGLIVQMHEYADRSEALEAVGLSE